MGEALELGFAGHETVAKGIPNGCIAFTNFPDEKARLAADPALSASAADEILRFDPPSQLQGRTTTTDVTLHGVTIPAGEKVMLITGSATRDERAYPDPDRFDVTREADPSTMFFGYGIHHYHVNGDHQPGVTSVWDLYQDSLRLNPGDMDRSRLGGVEIRGQRA